MAGELEDKKRLGFDPNHLPKRENTRGKNAGLWIVKQVLGRDGESQDYVWWRNREFGDLDDPVKRGKAAEYIARMKIEADVGVALGPAVDRHRSDPDQGIVVYSNEPGYFGVYIDPAQRHPSELDVNKIRVRDATTLYLSYPEQFSRIAWAALDALPWVA